MIKSILSLFNLDIFIERMPLSRGLFTFSREIHSTDQEFWGLGLHVVVSPLRMSPQ